MPATSERQRRFMGAVRGYKEGTTRNVSPAIKRAARSMSIEQTRDFTRKPKRGGRRMRRMSRRSGR